MSNNSAIETNLYEIFSRYNAEKEGDIDLIDARGRQMKYLKWMRGWTEVLKVDPHATYDVVADIDGNILHRVGTGGMVHIRVTINGECKEEWYPIESSPMHSVAYENITPSQVNKAIKRGMVKCLALFGLAANLYLNDELTEYEKDLAADDITEAINAATTLDQLKEIYEKNSAIVSGTPKIKALFTARKLEINKAEKK